MLKEKFCFEINKIEYYYVNVAPQWQIFNKKLWAKVEETVRLILYNDMSGNRWLIVTGSYGSCALPDADGVRQPMFLDPPSGIPVPLFYWKMLYNVSTRDGVVYMGLNDPYRKIDDSLFLCPNITCPECLRDSNKSYNGNNDCNNDDSGVDTNQGLIYCCTKESFELFYGELDPIVYRQL